MYKRARTKLFTVSLGRVSHADPHLILFYLRRLAHGMHRRQGGARGATQSVVVGDDENVADRAIQRAEKERGAVPAVARDGDGIHLPIPQNNREHDESDLDQDRCGRDEHTRAAISHMGTAAAAAAAAAGNF